MGAVQPISMGQYSDIPQGAQVIHDPGSSPGVSAYSDLPPGAQLLHDPSRQAQPQSDSGTYQYRTQPMTLGRLWEVLRHPFGEDPNPYAGMTPAQIKEAQKIEGAGSGTAENLGGYVQTGPIQTIQGLQQMAQGQIAKGGHRFITGAGTTLAPALPFVGAGAPAQTAKAIVKGLIGGKIAGGAAQIAGASPDEQQFAEDLGNIAGGTPRNAARTLFSEVLPRAAGSAAGAARNLLTNPESTLTQIGRRIFGSSGSIDLAPAEIIPPRRVPGDIAPEQVGTQPTSPNVLAGNQGVRVQPTPALPAGQQAIAALPESTATPLPAQSDTSLAPTVQMRRIEATSGNAAQQGQAVRQYLRNNPNASPQQVREFIFSQIDQQGIPQTGIGPDETGVPSTSTLGKRLTPQRESGAANPLITGTPLEPTPEATFPRPMSGEAAAAHFLTHQSLDTLQQVARNRGVSFSPGGDLHTSLIGKIVDSLKPSEIDELAAASIERSRFQPTPQGLRDYLAQKAQEAQQPTMQSGNDLLTGLQQMLEKRGLQPPTAPGTTVQQIRDPNSPTGFREQSITRIDPTSSSGIRISILRGELAKANNPAEQAAIQSEIERETAIAAGQQPSPITPQAVSEGLPAVQPQPVLSSQEPAPQANVIPSTSPTVPISSLRRGDTAFVNPKEMTPRPESFQFKHNVNERGTTNQFADVKTFDERLAGRGTAFLDPNTGELNPVNMHNRLGLAVDTGAPRILVHVLDTTDPVEARAVGALQNLTEGKGTGFDAAVFLRDSHLTPDDLARFGVSLSDARVSNALALKNLAPELLDKVGNGTLDEGRAAAIGQATDNPDLQRQILKAVQDKEKSGKMLPDDVVASLAKHTANAPNYETQTQGLFGLERETHSLAIEKAQVDAGILRNLRAEKTAFGAVKTQARAEQLGRAGNIIKPEENRAISERAGQAIELYNRLSQRAGPINKAVETAAMEISLGQDMKATIERATGEVRDILNNEMGGPQTGGAGTPATLPQ